MKLQAKTLHCWGHANKRSGDATWHLRKELQEENNSQGSSIKGRDKCGISLVFIVSHLRLLSVLMTEINHQSVWEDDLIPGVNIATVFRDVIFACLPSGCRVYGGVRAVPTPVFILNGPRGLWWHQCVSYTGRTGNLCVSCGDWRLFPWRRAPINVRVPDPSL